MVPCPIPAGQGRPNTENFAMRGGREDKRMNNRTMFPPLINNAVASHKGPVKMKLKKGAGLLYDAVLL